MIIVIISDEDMLIWNPSGTFLRLIISIKCLVLSMVYSDSLKSDNSFDKCFANWYVAVLKFGTIDWKLIYVTIFGNFMDFSCAV